MARVGYSLEVNMALYITVEVGTRPDRTTPILAIADPALVQAMLTALAAAIQARAGTS